MKPRFFLSLFVFSFGSLFATFSVCSAKEYFPATIIRVQQKSNYISSSTSPPPLNPIRFEEPSQDQREQKLNEAIGETLTYTFIPNDVMLITLKIESEYVLVRFGRSWRWKKMPDIAEGEKVQIRFSQGKDKVYIRQADGKETKTEMVMKLYPSVLKKNSKLFDFVKTPSFQHAPL